MIPAEKVAAVQARLIQALTVALQNQAGILKFDLLRQNDCVSRRHTVYPELQEGKDLESHWVSLTNSSPYFAIYVSFKSDQVDPEWNITYKGLSFCDGSNCQIVLPNYDFERVLPLVCAYLGEIVENSVLTE